MNKPGAAAPNVFAYNLRRGMLRLWVLGSVIYVLFVIAITAGAVWAEFTSANLEVVSTEPLAGLHWYIVRDPASGRTIRLHRASLPIEEELESLFRPPTISVYDVMAAHSGAINADQDVAALIRRSPSMTDEQWVATWNAFNSASSLDALTQKLTPLTLPTGVKADLWDLKSQRLEGPRIGDDVTDLMKQEVSGRNKIVVGAENVDERRAHPWRTLLEAFVLAVAPPLVALGLGWALAWVAAGFRPRPVALLSADESGT